MTSVNHYSDVERVFRLRGASFLGLRISMDGFPQDPSPSSDVFVYPPPAEELPAIRSYVKQVVPQGLRKAFEQRCQAYQGYKYPPTRANGYIPVGE